MFLMILALAGIVFATGFSPVVVTPGDAAAWAVSREYLSGLRQPQAPEVTAAGYILVNPTTGQIVLAHEEHARLAPASLTKIMTFMTATSMVSSASEGKWSLRSDLKTIKADYYPYSAIGMGEGDYFSLEEMLYILLVPSDNAAAVTIARSLAGSEQAFVGQMNALAAEWGLVNTRFVNAHGLDAGGQYSSPYDLAILSRAAMSNVLFTDIVRHVQIDKGGYRLTSTNELLSAYPGAVGIKTGTTEQAGQCLIGWVRRPAGAALTVVMGSRDRMADSAALLDYFYDNEFELVLDLPRSALNRYRDGHGNLHEFTIAEPVVFLVHPWELGSLRYVRRLWQLPEEPSAEEQLGMLEVWLNGRLLTEMPLYGRP
jgi:D-alanyl-D-alanine carboxypeptidase (penicillin-binding protein 5/6)